MFKISKVIVLLGCLIPLLLFAGNYKAGIVFQNATSRNLKLVSYRGDINFMNFVNKDLKLRLTNGYLVKGSIRTGEVSDTWQGIMKFASTGNGITLTVHYNGSYSPGYGNGLSCSSTGARCFAPGGWAQQQQVIYVYP